MTTIERGLIALAVLALLAFGCVQLGKHIVQVEWDKDKAVRQARLDDEVARNEKNIADLRAQFKKEKDYAESEASKRAVDRFLRDHGLLPDGTPMRPAGSGQAKVPQGTDGAACESGLAERIKEFAARCIDDARRVELCTAWAIREGLVAE